MADRELVKQLRQSVEAWNDWRRLQAPDFQPDLTHAALNDVDLKGADLSGAQLRLAELGGAVLEGCDLRNADLCDAYMVGANLTRAQMAGARLIGARLRGARLEGAILVNADLTDAILDGACLQSANLSSAVCAGASFVKADLSGANLTGANLTSASLCEADLSSARLRRANLQGADLQGARLDEATLVGAFCRNTVFVSSHCANTDLRNLKAVASDWSGADLATADLRSADLQRAILLGARLGGAKLEDTALKEALVDVTTEWPPGFDVREAIGANEAARRLAESRRAAQTAEPETPPFSLAELLGEIEAFDASEARWIASQFTLDPDDAGFEAQARSLADSDGDVLVWMESVFERRLSPEQIEASLADAERVTEEEQRLDRELWTSIQDLPANERETLERIDRMRRDLRDWCRTLPSELVDVLVDQTTRERGAKSV